MYGQLAWIKKNQKNFQNILILIVLIDSTNKTLIRLWKVMLDHFWKFENFQIFKGFEGGGAIKDISFFFH